MADLMIGLAMAAGIFSVVFIVTEMGLGRLNRKKKEVISAPLSKMITAAQSGANRPAPFYLSQSELDRVPERDLLVQGWRVFTPRLSAEGLVLYGSYGALGPWQQREEVAACGVSAEGEGRVACRLHLANGICTCGIYAFRERAMVDLSFSALVLAHVTLGGFIIPASLGFRAERCRIEHLYLMTDGSLFDADHMAEELSKRYGVPCEIERTPVEADPDYYPKGLLLAASQAASYSLTRAQGLATMKGPNPSIPFVSVFPGPGGQCTAGYGPHGPQCNCPTCLGWTKTYVKGGNP